MGIREAAPITSLIQRMGRCNRHTRPGEKEIGNIFIYQPEDRRPYEEEDMQGTDAFLEALDGREVSQTRLRELLEEHGPGDVEPDRYAAFVESGQ